MCSGYRNLYLIIFERKHLEKKYDTVLEFKIQFLKSKYRNRNHMGIQK